MIATILPLGVVCPHTVTVENIEIGSDLLEHRVRLYLLAVLNSFVVDYLLRQQVTAHLSLYLVYNIPVPRPALGSGEADSLVARAARLICTTSEFAETWQEVMGTSWTPESGVTDPAERASLRAELDGLVAHLYGLTESEFTHVLATFPLVSRAAKEAALAAYRVFTPNFSDPKLALLLLAGEGPRVEYKSTLRWDLKESRKNPELERVVLKTVAGFLNSPHGGTLLLGVADDGTPLGLERDYQTLGKKNRDGFELFLMELLLAALGKDLAPSFHAHFHTLETKELCRLEVAPSPRPVFLKEGTDENFYLRAGNSTRKLTAREAMELGKERWRRG